MHNAFDLVDHPELVELGAKVDRVVPVGKKFGVMLDRTPFLYQHADGGDRGSIVLPDGRALYVSAAEGREPSLHKIKDRAADDLAVGTAVIAKVDRAYRDALRSRHTACHLMYGLAQRQLGRAFLALSRTAVEKTYSEWKGVGPLIGDDFLEDLAARAAAAIAAAHPVSWTTLDRDEALRLVGEHFAQILPASAQRLRVVTIGDLAPDPCAGMHVRSLAEIDGLRVEGVERGGNDIRVFLTAAYRPKPA